MVCKEITSIKKTTKGTLIPTVIDKAPGGGERVYDIYSRLLEDRVIFLGEAIDSTVANTVIAQLLFLEKQDAKAPITMYINSPGGHVTAGACDLRYDATYSTRSSNDLCWTCGKYGCSNSLWRSTWKRYSLPTLKF